MIKIYEPNEKKFKTNGLGTIQPISCVETKKKGIEEWKISMTCDIKYKNLIKKDNILLAETKEKGAQAFRIQEPTISDQIIEVDAKHVLFDAENLILVDVRPENQSAVGYLTWCNERTDTKSPFTFSGNAAGTGTNYFIRKTLLDAMDQAQETFQAVFDCDNFNLRIMASVGSDNGYKVAYGKNIQGIKISQSWSDVVTKILPVGTNGVLLPEKFLTADISYEVPYTKVVKFDTDTQDDDGKEIPEETQIEQLRTLATAYLETNKYPQISYEVKSDVPQNLSIGDTIHIKHPIVDIPAEVQAYTYDCNKKRVKSLTFGNYDNTNSSIYQATLKSAISSAVSDVKDAIGSQGLHLSAVDVAMEKMNEEIKNSTGFYSTEVIEDTVTIHYIHDKPKMEDSKIIWRASAEVMSVSTDGGKTWNAAIDASGEAVLKTISANGINADWINAGTIKSRKIDNGAFSVDEKGNAIAKSINISGGSINISTSSESESVITLNYLNSDPSTGFIANTSSKFSPYTIETSGEYQDGTKEGVALDPAGVSANYSYPGGDKSSYTVNANGLYIEDTISGSTGFGNYSSSRCYLEYGGNYIKGSVSGGWTKGSDERLKENIEDLDTKELLTSIRPVSFKYKSDKGKHFGFIAQEVEKAFNEYGAEDAALITKPDEDTKYYGLDYNEFVAILWKICQEQGEEIKKLKEKVYGENI